MSQNTLKIARQVMRRIAVDLGTFGLSPEGFDMAEASAFIDETNISLSLALACEIAARAEETVEDGGSHSSEVALRIPTPRFRSLKKDDEGFPEVRERLLNNKVMLDEFRRQIRKLGLSSLQKFLDTGEVPTGPLGKDWLIQALRESLAALVVPHRDLMRALRSCETLAVGLLRDLGVNVERDSISISLASDQDRANDDEGMIEVLLDGEVFYKVTVFDISMDVVQPPSSVPGEKFLRTQASDKFDPSGIGNRHTEEMAQVLQKLNSYLHHPREEVRAEAEEWLNSPEGIYHVIIYQNRAWTSSNDIRAASRGFLKRVIKRYDEAHFGIDDIVEARRFFGKDLKMLLAKCWNKSELKSFGAFDLAAETRDFFLRGLCVRIAPGERSFKHVGSIDPETLSGLVAVCMIDCALRKMGVKIHPSKYSKQVIGR
jgi:hypothetical protein